MSRWNIHVVLTALMGILGVCVLGAGCGSQPEQKASPQLADSEEALGKIQEMVSDFGECVEEARDCRVACFEHDGQVSWFEEIKNCNKVFFSCLKDEPLDIVGCLKESGACFDKLREKAGTLHECLAPCRKQLVTCFLPEELIEELEEHCACAAIKQCLADVRVCVKPCRDELYTCVEELSADWDIFSEDFEIPECVRQTHQCYHACGVGAMECMGAAVGLIGQQDTQDKTEAEDRSRRGQTRYKAQ